MKSRLKVLVAEKAYREGRSISLRDIAAESGASLSTVVRMENNTIRRVPLDELAKLCVWLNCEVGDMLRLEDVGN